MIDDQLAMSKIGSGGFTAMLRPIDLTEVARSVTEDIRVVAGEHGLDLTVSFSGAIALTSTEGAGTTVTIRLPASEAAGCSESPVSQGHARRAWSPTCW